MCGSDVLQRKRNTLEASMSPGTSSRRGKRFNYADYDRLDKGHDNSLRVVPVAQCSPKPLLNVESIDAASELPHRTVAAYGIFGADKRSFMRELSRKVAPRPRHLGVRALATPLLGPFAFRFFSIVARGAYMFPASFYLRLAAAPALQGLSASGAPTPVNTLHADSGTAGMPSSVDTGSVGGGVLADCHPSVFVGKSAMHGRGLFTSTKLRRGTRILTTGRMALATGPQALLLLADTYDKLPDTVHYSHPTGLLQELTIRADARHLINHSCEANLCCGLSKYFWKHASCNAELSRRVKEFEYFHDPNSFFATRDIDIGEELTVDYHKRFAPLYAGDSSGGGSFAKVCQCGSPSCRHFIYPKCGAAKPYKTVGDALSDGFDDELCILSRVQDAAEIIEYVDNGVRKKELELLRSSKFQILQSYRHVFRTLNEAAPASSSDSSSAGLPHL